VSGIAAAASAPTVNPPPPPDPLFLNFNWAGPTPYNGAGASGTTSGFGNYFAHLTGGGSPPLVEGFTITYNPSGKLYLFAAGSNLGVGWSGMAINESQGITVQYTVTDNVGDSVTKSDSAVIKRVS